MGSQKSLTDSRGAATESLAKHGANAGNPPAAPPLPVRLIAPFRAIKMSHMYTSLLSHCIFSTKDRAPEIDEELRPQLFAYMGGIARSIDCAALLINGVADHVHLLLSLPATLSMADAMRLIKTNSSKWVHEQWPARSGFAWQSGYGAFSVSLHGLFPTACAVGYFFAAAPRLHK
jgi:putative transposase